MFFNKMALYNFTRVRELRTTALRIRYKGCRQFMTSTKPQTAKLTMKCLTFRSVRFYKIWRPVLTNGISTKLNYAKLEKKQNKTKVSRPRPLQFLGPPFFF